MVSANPACLQFIDALPWSITVMLPSLGDVEIQGVGSIIRVHPCEQCSKAWLVDDYRGLHYPIWGFPEMEYPQSSSILNLDFPLILTNHFGVPP